MRAIAAIMAVALVSFPAACGAPPTLEDPGLVLARAEAAEPADARLAALYSGSCRSCHTQPDTGAPLTHDRAAWDERWRKGEQILLEHTVSGFNGMPAGGQCFACSAEDYRALIVFMSGRDG